MLLVTLLGVLVIPLLVEALGDRIATRFWPPIRWTVLPPLGAATGAYLGLGILTMSPILDTLLAMFLGAIAAALVAVEGGFRGMLWTGPNEAQLAATGMRSYVHAKGRGNRA